jgi:micrococcal nuclease
MRCKDGDGGRYEHRRSWIGSAVLVALAGLVILRPWEEVRLGEEEPRSATAYVTRVVDGDTIEVRLDGDLEDVRYIGVDTPETVKPDTPVQCFGPRASRFNHRLVEHHRVRLVFGVERRDVYGRLLAYVHLGRRFVNPELVRRGLARTLTIPPNDRFAPLFARLERQAASAGRGLWGAC